MNKTAEGVRRKAIFQEALIEKETTLRNNQILPSDERLIEANPNITDVVFVIHGIRDTGYWTHKIARKVVALGRKESRQFETETSTYGYFPMLHFLLFARRRAKVEWLMDQYTEDKAKYPNAQFSFMGHSNGTYLLAKALEVYPSWRFKNVVLQVV